MARIVAFSVESKQQDEEVLDQLKDGVEDVATVYKSARGRVHIEQSSVMTAGKGVVRGGPLAGKQLMVATLCSFALVLTGCSSDGEATEQPAGPSTEPASSAPAVPTASPDEESTDDAAGAVSFGGGPCSTTVKGQRVDDDVEVRAGATCVLVDVTINGDVEVERGGILRMSDSTVDGDIQGEGHDDVKVRDSRVEGNIQLEDGGMATVSGVKIDGDLQSEDNRGRQVFSGNTIDGNLQCEGNQPKPTGRSNNVKGNKEDQCSGL